MPKIVYKATPKQFYDSICKTGLDPQKGGQIGGATSMSMAVRTPTKYDKGYTWLGPYSQALAYAQDKFVNRDPIILKVTIPDVIDGNIIKIKDRGTGGFTTKQLIPPQYIEVQVEKGDFFTNIAAKPEPYIITEDDQDFTDEW